MHSNEVLRRCCPEMSALPSRAHSYACKFSRVKPQHFFAAFSDSRNRNLAWTGVRRYLRSITSNILIFLEYDCSAFFSLRRDRALKKFSLFKGHMQTGPMWSVFFISWTVSILLWVTEEIYLHNNVGYAISQYIFILITTPQNIIPALFYTVVTNYSLLCSLFPLKKTW